MKETAYYFSHDSNAQNDEKIMCLRAEHGMQGYGIYWLLIERMFDNQDTCLRHSLLKGIAHNINIDIAVLQNVINTCIDVKLFVSEDDIFFSESLKKRKNEMLKKRQKFSDAGKAGMQARYGSSNDVNNTANKGKKSKGKETVKKIGKKGFLNGIVSHQEPVETTLWQWNKDQFLLVGQWDEKFMRERNISAESLQSEKLKFIADLELKQDLKSLNEIRRHFVNKYDKWVKDNPKLQHDTPSTIAHLRQA